MYTLFISCLVIGLKNQLKHNRFWKEKAPKYGGKRRKFTTYTSDSAKITNCKEDSVE